MQGQQKLTFKRAILGIVDQVFSSYSVECKVLAKSKWVRITEIAAGAGRYSDPHMVRYV